MGSGVLSFNKYVKTKKMFGPDGSSDYFDIDTFNNEFRFGEEDFNIRDIYLHFYNKVSFNFQQIL
jgi:hypothetical protein